jgi:hypothetical protein
MPKIRDLAINRIPSDRPANASPDNGGYWMCEKTTVTPPMSGLPGCGTKKNTRSLPHDAVLQLRQQLQRQIGNHLHG